MSWRDEVDGEASGVEDTLPLADEIRMSLKKYDDALSGMTHLVASLSAISFKIRTERWANPGPPKPGIWTQTSEPPPGLSPEELLSRWRAGGTRWLAAADRRELRAAIVALRVEPTARTLSQDPSFIKALLPRLQGRRLVSAISFASFAVFPPPKHVIEAARTLPPSESRPIWWSESGWPTRPAGVLARWLGEAVVRGELTRPGDLDVPDLAFSGEWACSIIEKVRPRSMEAVRRQLAFATGSVDTAGGVLTREVAAAIRGGVQLAERKSALRRDMAILARERVGSPFGAEAEARWRPIADLLPKVRAWLAGEVLAIVFEHLTPPNREVAHMTRPRKLFWSRYTGSVRKMWVAVTRTISPQLEHPDLKKLKAAMGNDLILCNLEGGPDQAIVWMHLHGSRGNVVTAIEGNANTSIRIREGKYSPRRKCIHYSSDIVRGEFHECYAFVAQHDPWRNWERKATCELLTYGIQKDPV